MRIWSKAYLVLDVFPWKSSALPKIFSIGHKNANMNTNYIKFEKNWKIKKKNCKYFFFLFFL